MAKQLFSNIASSTLAVSVAPGDTTIQVGAGLGVIFPNPTGGDWFIGTLEDSGGNVEYFKCTARSGDLLTVTRGEEGSSPQSFTNTVTRVEVRNTKGSMERMLQRSGDTLAGDLSLGGYALTNGDLDASVNIPNTSVFPVGMITLWSGSVGTIPTGWHLCDGTNGTPNLMDRFVLGAGNTYAPGATGGAATDAITTSADGTHFHGGATDPHSLTVAELPSHTHPLYVQASGGAGDTESFANAAAIAGNIDGTKGYLSKNSGGAGTDLMQGAGSGVGHAHTIGLDGGHTHTATVDTVPPYYALAYIMFTGT